MKHPSCFGKDSYAIYHCENAFQMQYVLWKCILSLALNWNERFISLSTFFLRCFLLHISVRSLSLSCLPLVWIRWKTTNWIRKVQFHHLSHRKWNLNVRILVSRCRCHCHCLHFTASLTINLQFQTRYKFSRNSKC